jgi:hypothetical protein
VFAAAAVLSLVALAIASLLREQPLRTTPSAIASPDAERMSADRAAGAIIGICRKTLPTAR